MINFILTALAIFVVIAIILFIFKVSIKTIISLAINMILGLVVIYLLNLIPGINLIFEWWTGLIVGFFGLAGVIVVLILSYIL